MTPLVAEARKLLEGVTGGPWEHGRHGVVWGGPPKELVGGLAKRQVASLTLDGERSDEERDANARFIAASPALVRSLCDEVEKWHNECVYLREEKAVLEAAIQSMKVDENMALALKQNAEHLLANAEARIAELEAKGERK